MNRRFDSPLFWGSHSPLLAFCGIGLIIMASSRFAFALVSAGALLWVYGLSALVFSNSGAIMPKRGKMVILLFLSAFLSGLYMLLMGFLNPLLILSSGYFLLLVPPCCLGSGLFEAGDSVESGDFFSRALQEAAVISGIIIALALIREPLGMGTLSIPGSAQGMMELFDDRDLDAFVPLKILSASSGGLLLLGYGTALFLHFRELNGGISRNTDAPEEEQ